MRRPLFLATFALIVLAPGVRAADKPTLVRSAKSGPWSEAKTWEGDKVPSAGVQVLIRPTHTVTYDVKSDAVIRSLHIAGVLTFAHDRDTRLDAGLIRIHAGEKIEEQGFEFGHVEKSDGKVVNDPGTVVSCTCCDGKPALLVGTQERPIEAKHTAIIRLHYIEGMDRESCPAIVCCGGRMDFHGTPMSRTWVKLGKTVAAPRRKGDSGASEITLAESVTGWKAGDRIIVTSSDRPMPGGARTEEATIKAIDGTTITLEKPLSHGHLGEGEFRAEVANLSRNVIVESADPDGVRGHTMYHKKSSGAVSYAEFRHLGKEGVLGRYNLHFHLCGDTMRGSSLVGASFHNSKNRFLTVHGTNYLVVRDCVGYKSVGHGFFLEDGTEVNNVFDRNLACYARDSKPLPKQILPFDPNDGAGFWFANAHNTFTRNVAVENRQYGFRLEATPRAGVHTLPGAADPKLKFGDPRAKFDLVMDIRQPDGGRKPVDIRTLPFVRFEDNETHGNGFWGLNLGQANGGVGPDASTPHMIRNMKIWAVVGGMGVESPCVLIDGLKIDNATYGVRDSVFRDQDWRNVSINSRGMTIASEEQYVAGGNSRRHRQPGWPQGKFGDGGARYQSAQIEAVKLTPIDKLPPITVITHVRKSGDGKLSVRGTTSDDGVVKKVFVNGKEARATTGNFGEWELILDGVKSGELKLSAHAQDEKGNVEITKHELTVMVR